MTMILTSPSFCCLLGYIVPHILPMSNLIQSIHIIISYTHRRVLHSATALVGTESPSNTSISCHLHLLLGAGLSPERSFGIARNHPRTLGPEASKGNFMFEHSTPWNWPVLQIVKLR